MTVDFKRVESHTFGRVFNSCDGQKALMFKLSNYGNYRMNDFERLKKIFLAFQSLLNPFQNRKYVETIKLMFYNI